MYPSRTRAAAIARDTLEILEAGRYENRAGVNLPIKHLLEAARQRTVSYPPEAALPRLTVNDRSTVFETANESTLQAALRLVSQGFNPVALNFASARHPGGGFLGGARAQEESLCRSSGLYPCINGNAMYQYHASISGGWYSNYAIYSPAVPVFKDDSGQLHEEPYLCGFVTSPAINAGVIRDKDREPIHEEMRLRVDKVLAIMAGHGHDAAVLGAWGCGVFKNDPDQIAQIFAKALRGRFSGAFAKVVFAVLDSSDDRHFIGPFEERCGGT